jgi:hypothetical protein
MEVNFPPVPNVEEVRFGTPLNQRFGKTTVGQDLQVVGGYKPGSELSRDLIAYSNVYWATKLASSFGGKPVGLLTAERVNISFCKSIGVISRTNAPFVILNNAYSTSYDLGNTKGFEEVYYLKRISKGWIFRSFPDKWQAYVERPDETCELLKEFATKPSLRDVAFLVRAESFKRYAIFNDRWSPGFGGR